MIGLFYCSSGQTKQNFVRNTETETRATKKAEILAETEISADTLYRPKYSVSAEILCFDFAFLLQIFKPKFGPKNGISAKKPKAKNEESRNTETEKYFGRN